jgi:hypothetical protein
MPPVILGLMGLRLAILACVTCWTAFADCQNVPAWTACDIAVELTPEEARAHPYPWQTVEIKAELRSPEFKTFLIHAFWDGGSKMVLRMTSTQPGEWTYRITSNLKRLDGTAGSFTSAASERAGFIEPANVHHWKHATGNKPHLWMGQTLEAPFTAGSRADFEAAIDALAAARFTHVAAIVDPDPKPGPPALALFQELDHRIRYVNAKGLIADLILAPGGNRLAAALTTWQARARYVRYLVSRYSAFDITWLGLENWEEYTDARALLKEIGTLIKDNDAYGHPRSTHSQVTAAPLLGDGWMNFLTYGTLNAALGAVEHQLYPLPAINVAPYTEPRAVWNAQMNGQYPALRKTDPAAAKIWFEFFEKTRFWELEPYFDADGGRAVALDRVSPDDRDGVEYIFLTERAGPVEIGVDRRGYDTRWINIDTGEVTVLKDFKGERFTGEPPAKGNFVLHLSREGHKQSMGRSYRFESRTILQQEVETSPKLTPFDIAAPGETMPAFLPAPYAVKMRRETRATRQMLFLWQGEVAVDGQGYRVLATGREGQFQVPRELIKRMPAVLSLRLYGMNAYGKVYMVDRVVRLTP